MGASASRQGEAELGRFEVDGGMGTGTGTWWRADWVAALGWALLFKATPVRRRCYGLLALINLRFSFLQTAAMRPRGAKRQRRQLFFIFVLRISSSFSAGFSLAAIFLFISNPARGALNGGIVATLNKAHGWARVNDGVGLGLWMGVAGARVATVSSHSSLCFLFWSSLNRQEQEEEKYLQRTEENECKGPAARIQEKTSVDG
ncbi:hypothetical protein M0R45_001392 [Rubus argutus]|uniref:Uncharacterized protein n=1 Tax=Rubus argutus TaxID=59490 RepID=A0AAW1VMZ7_RUBAR